MSKSNNPKDDNANGGESNPAESASKSKKVETSTEKPEVKKELSKAPEKTQEEATTQPATATTRTVTSIEALEEIREQQRLWRYGAYVGGLIFLILVLVVVSQVKSFIPPTSDPKMLVEQTKTLLAKTNYQGQNNWEKLVLSMNKGWEEDVQADLKNILHNTTNTIHGDFVKPWSNLNQRSTEIVKAANDQLSLLEGTLPQEIESVVNERLEKVMSQREAKLQEINPEATKEQIDGFVSQLITLGGNHAETISNEIFAEHLSYLNKIFKSMDNIRDDERSRIRGAIPNWEMALLILDIIREEMRPLQVTAPASSIIRNTPDPSPAEPEKNPNSK